MKLNHQKPTTMTQTTKTLETIATELSNNQGYNLEQTKERISQAAFLTTIEAASEVLSSKVTPTPLYRIDYDRDSSKFEITPLNGRGLVPTKHAIDIEYVDLIFASLAHDKISFLSEGITGTGKTHTIEHTLKTIYSPDNVQMIRLNANMSNVLQPYIQTTIEDGALKIRINKEAVEKTAAIFIDEQNRGNPNEIMSIIDGKIALSTGEQAELGLPIPQLIEEEGKIKIYFTDKKKPVTIHSAQNPPDPQYSGTRRTDGALMNRQLKLDFPTDMALHSGAATLNMGISSNHQHENFMKIFSQKLAGYLNLDESKVNELLVPQDSSDEEKTRANEEYLNLHAFSFDPDNTQNTFFKSAVELADHIIMLTGGTTLQENFEQEKEIAQGWTSLLGEENYEVDFTYLQNIDEGDNALLRIEEVRNTFSEPLIERDKTKATKLADTLALIIRYKNAYKKSKREQSSALDEFRKLQIPLTVTEVASAYTIVLNNKSQNGVSSSKLINQAFKDYKEVLTEFSLEIYGKGNEKTKFNSTDKSQSITYIVSYLAVQAVTKEKELTADELASKMIVGLNNSAYLLRSLDKGNETKKLLIAKVNADLASVAGFIHEHRKDIKDEFDAIGDDTSVLPRYNALVEIVKRERERITSNYTMPRVEKIFGV